MKITRKELRGLILEQMMQTGGPDPLELARQKIFSVMTKLEEGGIPDYVLFPIESELEEVLSYITPLTRR